MKRFLALFTALLLVCLSLPVFAAAEEEKPLWLVKYNDATIEGAGVVFTETYTHAEWWLHAAFAPTDVEGVWKITAISDGIVAGNAQPLAIPEGGFVYAPMSATIIPPSTRMIPTPSITPPKPAPPASRIFRQAGRSARS